MAELLEVHGLTLELPTPAGWVRPVNGVSLSIAEGESLGLVGESGSGKTMLSLALMGLLLPGAHVSGDRFVFSILCSLISECFSPKTDNPPSPALESPSTEIFPGARAYSLSEGSTPQPGGGGFLDGHNYRSCA